MEKETSTALAPIRSNLPELREVSRLFAESGYFPDAKSMAQAFVKIATGREIGISPMASMTGIAIIQGKPVVGANIIAAKVKMSGYNYQIRRLDNTGCVIDFIARDGSALGTSSFTEEDAKAAGLLGKDNWRKFARNMYFARAISNGQRWFCPDATQGQIVYTPDELGGKVDEEGNPVAEAEWTPAPAPVEPQAGEEDAPQGDFADPEYQKRREIYEWGMALVHGDPQEYAKLITRESSFTGKDGAVQSRDSEAKLKGKWLNKVHHRIKELAGEPPIETAPVENKGGHGDTPQEELPF